MSIVVGSWVGLLLVASAQEPTADPGAPPTVVAASSSAGEDPYGLGDYQPTRPGQVGYDTPHFALEVMYHRQEHVKGVTVARELLAKDPKDKYLPLHLARFLYHLGEEEERTNSGKVAYYQSMVVMLDEALVHNPGDLHLRFARAVSLARLGTSRGVMSSLRLATTIESEWKAVAESDLRYESIAGEEILPCDAQYSLGVFYRLVPDYWIVQLLAGTRGDLTKSIAYLEQADACRPNMIRYRKELGVSLLCKGQKSKDAEMVARGRAVIAGYQQLKPVTNTEVIDVRHAQVLLDDPSIACGYSRDGVQDLDVSKLKE